MTSRVRHPPLDPAIAALITTLAGYVVDDYLAEVAQEIAAENIAAQTPDSAAAAAPPKNRDPDFSTEAER